MSDSNDFEAALDSVAAGRSPTSQASSLSEDERRMVQMAQLIRGSAEPDQARASVTGPSAEQSRPGRPIPISRRAAVLSGLGAMAAGVAAGVGLDRALNTEPGPERLTAGDGTPIVGNDGHWAAVAAVADLPEGGVKSFNTGALAGFLIRRNGRLRAVSAACTHMGCLLNYDRTQDELVCPCHRAQFDLSGRMTVYPGVWNAKLPPLPKIKVRVNGPAIEVWTA